MVVLSRSRVAPDQALPLLREVQGAEQAQDFLEAATLYGVQGLVLSAWSALNGPETTLDGQETAQVRRSTAQPVREVWAKHLEAVKKQALFWDLEQERVLASLSRNGLRPVVLKGGALRRLVYENPVQRLMGDLDILTEYEEVPDYLEALGAIGYRSEYSGEARRGFREHHYHDRVAHPTGFLVEIHWGLTRPGGLCQLDHREFIRRAQQVEAPGHATVLAPSPEDMLLHIVSQIEQEGYRSIRRMVDLDRVVRASDRMDWDYVLDRARKGNLAFVLSVSLRLANILFLTPVQDRFLDGRILGPMTRHVMDLLRPVSYLMQPRHRAEVAGYDLFRIWSLPRWDLRRQAFVELIKGVQDPLDWVWREMDSPEELESEGGLGLSRTAKLLALQVWIGGRGILGKLGLSRRPRISFWKTSGSVLPSSGE
jgi:hypothetical protein